MLHLPNSPSHPGSVLHIEVQSLALGAAYLSFPMSSGHTACMRSTVKLAAMRFRLWLLFPLAVVISSSVCLANPRLRCHRLCYQPTHKRMTNGIRWQQG